MKITRGNLMSELISFLAKIEWTFTYGVFQGTVEDSESVVSILGSDEQGTLQILSAALSGSQETKFAWFRDEGWVKLRVLSVSEPKE